MRPAPGTLALLTAAASLGGCGAYTKRDFIARADAICASTVRETRLVPPPSFTHGRGQQLSALARYIAGVLPLVEAEERQLRALPRPEQNAGDRLALARYLTAFGTVVSSYRDLGAAAARADAQGVQRAKAALAASMDGSLAALYGLRSCGTAGATSA